MNKYLLMLIKSPLIRARILSGIRVTVAGLGASLVTKGYVDDSSVQLLAGAAVSIASFWLGDVDVKQVDKKIEAAVKISPKTSKDKIEQEVTKQLNKHQNKAGTPGKTGW